MEITSTTLSRTARHTTEKGIFNIDYIITNGILERIQLNISKPATESEVEAFMGSVYYDSRNITCNIPLCEDAVYYFEAAMGFIGEIVESTRSHSDAIEAEEKTNDKSR